MKVPILSTEGKKSIKLKRIESMRDESYEFISNQSDNSRKITVHKAHIDGLIMKLNSNIESGLSEI